MPSVTYNSQSFAIDGRRFWILGASMQYARIPPALWRARIAAARQAGFNTIETAAPWHVHEPRRGRFAFEDQADIRKFIEAAAAEGMRVILRIGPFIGHGFDGGGLPGWLIDTPGIALREANELYLEHVSRYFRRLLSEVTELQVTVNDGPIILVQAEHAWTCSNQQQADRYLHEITRFIRESGVTVPVLNANDLWQESPGTIDTWRGAENLLFHLRQMRTVQPMAPRLVSEFMAAERLAWGEAGSAGKGGRGGGAGSSRTSGGDESTVFGPAATLQQFAEVLAAGAQAIVAPFHAGTNFGFLAGRRAGCAPNTGGFLLTSAACDAPLGEAGERGEKYRLLKRLVTFANHFSGVFTELDSEYHPIALDPREATAGASNCTSVVSLRGSQGRVLFVFGRPSESPTTLVLDNGLRLPVTLGDQSVTWSVLDADLQGAGRLDYCNICPWAVVDRAIVVFHGPEKAPVYVSIDGTPLEASVPPEAGGGKPLVVEHHGLTVVILNRRQIDATYHNAQNVYVGIAGFDVHGQPLPDPDWPRPWVISAGARIESLAVASERSPSGRSSAKRSEAITIAAWQPLPAGGHVSGASPRFASLEGPATLSDCGAPSGYGWYRLKFTASGRHTVMLPHAGDRLHLFLNGHPERVVGVGPGARSGPFDMKFDRGEQTLVALADNFGRFCEGNDIGQRKGLFGHLYAVKPIRGKAKIASAKAVQPFALRGFIEGREVDIPSDERQAIWTFQHPKRTPVIVDVRGARVSGTFVLNDKPLAYYAGESGACAECIVIDPAESAGLKRGKNVLRFAPDLGAGDAEDAAQRTRLYEAVEALSDKAEWAFAKWEPPAGASARNNNHAAAASVRAVRGQPCWWRATLEVDAAVAASDRPLWLELAGMSKGQAFVNNQNLGRYFTATGEGKPAGPQTRLYVPPTWLKAGAANEVALFDEHGFEPAKVKLIRA